MSEAAKTSVRNIRPFGLRMQPELKEKLQALADQRGVSLNELITSTLSEVFRGEDPTRVVVLNLPSYLHNALSAHLDHGGRDISHAILDVLRRAFPNAAGVEAVTRAGEDVIGELWALEDGAGDAINTTKLTSAILDLLEIYSLNFSEKLPPEE